MNPRSTLPLFILAATIAPAAAQSFYTPLPYQFIAPADRPANGSSASAEYSKWDDFYTPYQSPGQAADVNYPDQMAPNGPKQSSEDAATGGFVLPSNISGVPDAYFNTSNPSIAQVKEPSAIIAASKNIYSSDGATGFVLRDTTPFALGYVNLQWETDGTPMDTSTLKLTYTNSGGSSVTINPAAMIIEYRPTNDSHGFSFGSRLSAQWALPAGVSSYQLTWDALGSSASLTQVLLDNNSTYSVVTPVDNGFRGNRAISTGTSAALGGNEISLLTLTSPGDSGGNFSLNGTGTLQVNSGITINPATPTKYVVSTPYKIGSFNIFEISTGSELTISSQITGNEGFYKSGEGTLRLTTGSDSTASTFVGQVAYDGGDSYVSRAMSYTGNTNIFSGRLILQGDAPTSGAGVLGASTQTQIGGNEDDATVVIDGQRTIGRLIVMNNGTGAKTLFAQSTGTGAIMSGAVVLGGTAANVRLGAVASTDNLTLSGGLTTQAGTVTNANTVTKFGAGTVTYDGPTKNYSYAHQTVVAEGTLRIAAGTTVASPGNMSVSAGAKLQVNGNLNGAGTLTLNGGTLGGTGNVNRTFTVDGGDTVSPGASVGTLTTLGETWASNGRLRLEVSDALGVAGAGYDWLKITGTLALSLSGAEKFTIEVASLTSGGVAWPAANVVNGSTYLWKFASATTSITGFNAGNFQFDTSGFSNAGNFSVEQTGNDLFVRYLAVPEPGAAVLLGVGALLCARRRRKR